MQTKAGEQNWRAIIILIYIPIHARDVADPRLWTPQFTGRQLAHEYGYQLPGQWAHSQSGNLQTVVVVMRLSLGG